ncbi:hypothetical protein BH23ACT9_BH23ACT9_02770 [soil metagenome]
MRHTLPFLQRERQSQTTPPDGACSTVVPSGGDPVVCSATIVSVRVRPSGQVTSTP